MPWLKTTVILLNSDLGENDSSAKTTQPEEITESLLLLFNFA